MEKSFQKEIISNLIKSCVDVNPSTFLPYLKNKDVNVNMINKMLFYSFFKQMMNFSKLNSKNKNFYKFKKMKNRNQSLIILNIYDDSNKYAKLSFILKNYSTEKFIIEILPF